MDRYNFRFAYTLNWTGRMNMEADRYFGEVSPPDLPFVRLYTWNRPTISYGRNQNPDKRINQALCEADGIPVVMRPTGGRELLHGHDICYSVAWPTDGPVSVSKAKEFFGFINDTLIAGLAGMGINAEWRRFQEKPKIAGGPCFAQIDLGEITVAGKKLVGSAQRVYNSCLIQQGSIPLRRPDHDLLKYLVQDRKMSLGKAMDDMTTFLLEETEGIVPDVLIIDKFKSAFENSFGCSADIGDHLLENFQGIIMAQSL